MLVLMWHKVNKSSVLNQRAAGISSPPRQCEAKLKEPPKLSSVHLHLGLVFWPAALGPNVGADVFFTVYVAEGWNPGCRNPGTLSESMNVCKYCVTLKYSSSDFFAIVEDFLNMQRKYT